MPLFEYRCESCGHVFEKIQKSSAKRAAACPHCGAAAKRQLSAPAIHFKGTGWYITDYARKGQGKEKEEKSEPSGKTDDKKSPPSESTAKPKPKPKPKPKKDK